MVSWTPESVASKGLCIGCGVCTIAFPDKYKLAKNTAGFIEPIPKKSMASGSGLSSSQQRDFKSFCPGLGYKQPRPDGAVCDPMWGPYISSYEGWATDPKARENGSSGGTITGVLKFLLETAEVDGVVAITASRDSPLDNVSILVTNPDDVSALAGSRYAPASPFQALQNVPKNIRVAVVGKPCDIAGIRNLKLIKPESLPEISYYISFYCAGTPSSNATIDAANHLNTPKVLIETIRYRGDGWPGKFSIDRTDNSSVSMSYQESWGTILNKQLHNRCKICLDGMGSTADIVAADSWATDAAGYPLFNEGDGRSALIARTQSGDDLLHRAHKANSILLANSNIRKLDSIQPSQVTRRMFARSRALGYQLAGQKVPHFRNFARRRWSVRHPIATIRQLVGSFRRARDKNG